MAGNAGKFMNQAIPDYLRNRPLHFMKNCINNIRKAGEEINDEMVESVDGQNAVFKVNILATPINAFYRRDAYITFYFIERSRVLKVLTCTMSSWDPKYLLVHVCTGLRKSYLANTSLLFYLEEIVLGRHSLLHSSKYWKLK